MMKRSPLAATLLCFALWGLPSRGDAQQTGPGLEAIPKAGVFFAAYHFTTYDQFHYRFQPTLAYGLVADYRFRNSPWGIRVDANLARSRLFGPGIFDIRSNGPDANQIIIVVADGVYRIPAGRSRVQAYLAAGAGFKRHEMKAAFASADITSRFAESQMNLALHLGGGVDVWLGPVAVTAGLDAYSSTFDVNRSNPDRWLHDMIASLGLRVALPKARTSGPEH